MLFRRKVMYYIGIDLGTSSVKLILTDGNGQILNSISREYPLSFPKPGWSEQNPYDWYEQVVDGLKELICGVEKSEVSGISFGGQMHGLVLLDENDEVIRPAILWNDGRSVRECEFLNDRFGKDKLSEYTANIAFAGFTAPKLLWVRENEPENFKKIRKIMLPKDYIAYRLSGVFATDVSDASGTLYFDVKNRCWSKEMCELCGISEDVLPKVFESYEVIGSILPELSALLGIPAECKIVAGAGDNAAAAIGTGTVDSGSMNISLGTSGTIFIAADSFCVDRFNALHSFAHANGRYHLMGCMLSAASCNKWWNEEILGTNDYQGEEKAMDRLGDNHVYFLPYLMGERSPINDPFARGTFTGITMDTTRADMGLSVLEGVTFALKDSLRVAEELGIRPTKTRLCGGGAKSRLWQRLIADILNLEVEILEAEEGPALGAAMLAMVGCGEYKTVSEAAANIVKVKNVILPEYELVKKYEKQYNKFREIYPACRELFLKLI